MAKQNKEYVYVDCYQCDENGKSSPWKRKHLDDVPKWQHEEAKDFNCFATVQKYANEKKTEGEDFLAPLYFDLDYSENPAVAQEEAIKLVEFFTGELDIQEQDLHIYFSGSKGFHILVDERALGVEPRKDLQRVYKHIAGYLRYRLGEVQEQEDENGRPVEYTEPLKAVDLGVYTVKRMLRLPYSRHQKTGLYKIELTLQQLKELTLDEIKERARTGQPIQREEKTVRKRPKAGVFYADKLHEYEEAAATTSDKRSKTEYIFVKDKPPICVEDILNNGWKKDGDRNNATVQLCCYFKAAGYKKEEATSILEDWVVKFTSADSRYSIQQRKANTRNVIESVYGSEKDYQFGCAFIRSLHGEKKKGDNDYDRVPCAGDMCPCIKGNTDVAEEAINLPLAKTSDASLTGKLITTRVMVAGKKHTPYVVPKKVEYSCWGQEKCKKYGCPLLNIPTATAYKELNAHNRELIQMTETGDDNIKGILREISGIPSCGKYDTSIVETINVDELLVIPMAEEDGVKEDDTGSYVLRKIYAIGGMKIETNKYYEISGYMYPHPKNQESTILVTNATPLQDVVESFSLTEEVREELDSLRPESMTVENIVSKLGTILNDLTYNVTHIVERDEVLLGLLLVYHSILRFRVPWDTDPIRGWVELKIVGDTGTGKSALVEKMMKYIGLGNRVNAESTSRTGLTYKMEQGNRGSWYIVWGAWPLADKELIWVDEDTGIEKDEYGEMTLARSDGKLEVKRAVTAETPCRVRAILSGNAPKGKRLSDYAQGAESLKDVFNNEDIRRFDFAIFMRSTDVDPEKYNRSLPSFPRTMSDDALKNNVLFAWSRTPEQVVFLPDTVDAILETATKLSKVYGNATDIPLVSPSDQRNKVARLTVALASLTHSVDESGERITVYPAHVNFIYDYLVQLYNAPGCGLNYYARLAVSEEIVGDKFDKITNELRKLDTLKGASKYNEFIDLFARQKYLRLGDVEAMLSIEKEEAKAIINQCVRLRMLTMTSGGYRKTPRFNSYISKCFEMGLFDHMENDI